LQRIWSHTHSAFYLLSSPTNRYHAAIIKAKRIFTLLLFLLLCLTLINFGKLLIKFFIVNLLMLCQTLHPSNLSNALASYFSSKIHKLCINIRSNSNSPHITCPHIPPHFDVFRAATFAEVSIIISKSPDTRSDFDPIPSTLLKKSTSAHLTTITTVNNLSLAFGVFPDQFKSSSVHCILKQSNSDKNELSNYRPTSHLSFLSKLTMHVVKSRLTGFSTEYNLLN
jgi:hypothetical protein